MKKIISTILVLAMVLTMALTSTISISAATAFVLGENSITAELNGYTYYEYTATESGTLTIAAAATETDVMVYQGWDELSLPYSVFMAAGQTLEFDISSVAAFEGQADTIDLVVSFVPGNPPTVAEILSGTYDAKFWGEQTHTITFTPASEGATNGSVEVTGINANYKSGTYTYSYDATTGTITTTTITAESPDLTLTIENYTLKANVGALALELVASTTSGGGATTDPILEALNGAYYVEGMTAGEEMYNVVFTPASEGAANGTLTLIDNSNFGDGDVNYGGTYTYTYDATTGSITTNSANVMIGIGYANMLMIQTPEFRMAQTLVEDTTPPTITDGGSGSPNTGDNVALYVAVGAVAIAAILGCAIVSKKRVTE